MLIYLSAAAEHLGTEELARAVKQAVPDREGWIMATLAETWVQQGIQQGLHEGLQQGLQQGLHEGLEQGKQQATLALTLRLLERRVGAITSSDLEQIRALPIGKLEQLSEDVLDFNSPRDLAKWLNDKL